MEIFHLVPLGISKFISNMDCRSWYKISKMSKNSPKSFVVRENLRLEVGKNSLLIQGIFLVIQVANSNQPCLYLITGPKIITYSIIIFKTIGLRICSGHGRITQRINPKITKRQHCHFCQTCFMSNRILEP